ncbi:MAG: hypothetical protein K0S76_2712 [Herbinix sp.]|jgi:sortase B|nr:hypothetical protein [Herbinix sp.]
MSEDKKRKGNRKKTDSGIDRTIDQNHFTDTSNDQSDWFEIFDVSENETKSERENCITNVTNNSESNLEPTNSADLGTDSEIMNTETIKDTDITYDPVAVADTDEARITDDQETEMKVMSITNEGEQDMKAPTEELSASRETDHNLDVKEEKEVSEEKIIADKKKKQILRYKIIRSVFTLSFLVFTGLFLNEVLIQPFRSRQAIDKINDLYQSQEDDSNIAETAPSTVPEVTGTPSSEPSNNENQVKAKDPKRDKMGRLLQFQDLLEVNEDVKGWITIPGTNVDYVVVQPDSGDPEYYLKKNIYGEYDKAGTLFLDKNTSIEDKTKNMVIHGHNMYSLDNMFHQVNEYKELEKYKERPVFTFDTIFQTGKWKVFAVFITNGTTKKEPLFDYTRTDFTSTSDFLNFVYQIRIRSMYFMDTVDVNEDDQLLMLSTCSYEVKDYRTVVVARKVREGEDLTVDVDSVTINEKPLLPYSYYYRHGGKAPKITETFEAAYEAGEIKWYKPGEEVTFPLE